jgi:predicted TIM-barrel fold metal-dependent hydrolase
MAVRRQTVVGVAVAALMVSVGVFIETRPTLPPASNEIAPAAPSVPDSRAAVSRHYWRIDTHVHLSGDSMPKVLSLMDMWGLAGVVNLSGMHPGPPRYLLESQLELAKQSAGRVAVFMTPNFMRALRTAPTGYGKMLAEELEAGHKLGAVGLKISKGLGLGYPMPDGQTLMPVDDSGLDPLFEKAGQLGMPVAIHTGDPKAFWMPNDAANERQDELTAHPGWSMFGESVPTWQALYDQFEHRVARHPKTVFIGVHFGNAPEDPALVSRMLDRYPNLYIDTAARVPEIGRHPQEAMRAFFTKYQDRILFATDTGVGDAQEDMMYGSTGSEPATLADEDRFFTGTYRYFETADRAFDHPTPIQGRWKIDGVGLPESVLHKVYFENAARLLRWSPRGFSVRERIGAE